jgi:hypothetical protein
MKQYAGRVREALTRSHRLASRLDEPGFPLPVFEALQDWQRDRLARSYADLVAVDRYRAAAEFFLTELYGGLHFRERDHEVERVLPIMIRMLRDDMLLALAEAFELQALSLDLDMSMARVMADSGLDALDVESYGTVYRACGRAGDRARQIELIRQLGLVLNELVHHRVVLLMVRMVRGPARAAGFGLLQSFLESGLFAFRAMGDGTEFVEAIWERERRAMQKLLAGEQRPFD